VPCRAWPHPDASHHPASKPEPRHPRGGFDSKHRRTLHSLARPRLTVSRQNVTNDTRPDLALIHPKPPALIRPRACTSLVPRHASPFRAPPQLGRTCPASPSRDRTGHNPLHTSRVDREPCLHGCGFCKHALTEPESTDLTLPCGKETHPTTAASIGLRANTMVVLVTQHAITRRIATSLTTTYPTLRHRSRDHADRVGGFQIPTKQNRTCLDTTQQNATYITATRRTFPGRNSSLSASSKTQPCRPRERFP
jgi:hypothetical protein